jgi:RHS repeat-associated protein
MLPIAFCLPAMVVLPAKLKRGPAKRRPQLSLYYRCLSVMLAYVMLISPACLQSLAEGAVQYSQLDARHWTEGNRTVEYAYDDNGSLTSKVTSVTSSQVELARIEYTYNLQNRLVEVRTSTDERQSWSVVEYKYDPDGNRVAKIVDGITTDSLIDAHNHTGYSQVFVETTGTDKTAYIIADDVLTQATGNAANAPKYLLYDGHGSTRQLSDSTGNLIADESYSYDAYGVMLGGNPTREAPAATSLLYAGEQFDTHLQQYYLRARYYDPLNGVFNQTDPYPGNHQDPQSLHKYLYCHANPINNVDPTGLLTIPEVLVTIAIKAIKIGLLLAAGYVVYLAYKWFSTRALIASCTFLDEERLGLAVNQMKRWPDGHRMQDCAKWLQPAVILGYEANNQVKVFPGDENDIYGMHADVSPFLFVCEWVVNTRNDLELALIIFAEWQHHPAGDDMDEGPAQAEFELIRADVRRVGESTPFIEGLSHGGRQ